MSMPNEILQKIFYYLPNLNKYSVVNKGIKILIDRLFYVMENKFESYVPSWKTNKNNLVLYLLKNNKTKKLIFLINNYNVNYNYVYRKLAQFGKPELFDVVKNVAGFINYNEIAKGAGCSGNLILIEFALKNGANYDSVLEGALKCNNDEIIGFAIKNGANIEKINEKYKAKLCMYSIKYDDLKIFKKVFYYRDLYVAISNAIRYDSINIFKYLYVRVNHILTTEFYNEAIRYNSKNIEHYLEVYMQ